MTEDSLPAGVTAEPAGTAEPATTLEPTIHAPTTAAAAPGVPPLYATRRLIGASFDLLGRSSTEMRRASFQIGLVVLLLCGPIVLMEWLSDVAEFGLPDGSPIGAARDAGIYTALEWLALVGLVIAAIDSRTIAAAVLGAQAAGRTLTRDEAVARARQVFWKVVGAVIVVGIVVLIAQGVAAIMLGGIALGTGVEAALGVAVGALVGAPLAYVLTGIVLGDVGLGLAINRSFTVFKARRLAAVLVAVFETVALLLVVLGLEAGLDLVLRALDALGLGPGSGPVGIAVVTAIIGVGTFAFGTLLYTVTALAIAPQVVMFVGLTRATMGLDHVLPGGDRSPDPDVDGVTSFRSIPWRLRGAAVLGWIGLAVAAWDLSRPS